MNASTPTCTIGTVACFGRAGGPHQNKHNRLGRDCPGRRALGASNHPVSRAWIAGRPQSHKHVPSTPPVTRGSGKGGKRREVGMDRWAGPAISLALGSRRALASRACVLANGAEGARRRRVTWATLRPTGFASVADVGWVLRRRCDGPNGRPPTMKGIVRTGGVRVARSRLKGRLVSLLQVGHCGSPRSMP